jgi:hypothetical protein
MEKRTAAMNLQGLTWGGGTFESASRAFLAVDEFFGTLNIFGSLRICIFE